MDHITLEDFLRLCVDDTGLTLVVYDTSLRRIVYKGWADETDPQYLGRVVSSFDIPYEIGALTVNIEGTEF